MEREQSIIPFRLNQITSRCQQVQPHDQCGEGANSKKKDYREKIEKSYSLVIRRKEP